MLAPATREDGQEDRITALGAADCHARPARTEDLERLGVPARMLRGVVPEHLRTCADTRAHGRLHQATRRAMRPAVKGGSAKSLGPSRELLPAAARGRRRRPGDGARPRRGRFGAARRRGPNRLPFAVTRTNRPCLAATQATSTISSKNAALEAWSSAKCSAWAPSSGGDIGSGACVGHCPDYAAWLKTRETKRPRFSGRSANGKK